MKKIILSLILILVLIASVQVWVTQGRTSQKNDMEKMPEVQETTIGGAFTLTDQDGKTVHDTDFHGRIALVAFGFTHCPDICPITVSTLSKTLELLADKADQVSVLFITVDPRRDTPAVMKDFLSNFDKHIIGLTGTELQIKQVADAYKIYYAPSTAPPDSDKNATYNVDHSGYIYMMGKEGQFIRVFAYNAPEQEIAAAVEAVLR